MLGSFRTGCPGGQASGSAAGGAVRATRGPASQGWDASCFHVAGVRRGLGEEGVEKRRDGLPGVWALRGYPGM